MTPFTADELVILVKARDLLGAKQLHTDDNQAHYKLGVAHGALLDVMRHSYLDAP